MIYHGTIILKRKLFSILTRFNKLSSKNLKIEPCQNLSHAIYNIPLKFNCLWMFNVLMLTKKKCWKLDKNELKEFFFLLWQLTFSDAMETSTSWDNSESLSTALSKFCKLLELVTSFSDSSFETFFFGTEAVRLSF